MVFDDGAGVLLGGVLACVSPSYPDIIVVSVASKLAFSIF